MKAARLLGLASLVGVVCVAVPSLGLSSSAPTAAKSASACGANPVPIIIPCHRVIASDGSLGGFGGGLALKKRLLALEGFAVDWVLSRKTRSTRPRTRCRFRMKT